VPWTTDPVNRAGVSLSTVLIGIGARAARSSWDDHDYGKGDAGAEFSAKRESQAAFLDFFGVPEDSPRRRQEGVYHSAVLGPAGRRVQVILIG
jgi:hypothetical protein